MRKPEERSAAWREPGNGGAELFPQSRRSDEEGGALSGDDEAEDQASEDYDLIEDDELEIDEEDALEMDEDEDEVEDDGEGEEEDDA